MNTRIVAVFNRKKSLIGIMLLTTLLVVTLVFYKTSQLSKNLSVFSDGLSTCMARVYQSYSAKLLGDSSNGLFAKGFLDSTEDCVADVMAFGNEKLGDVFKNNAVLLNTFATDVHWFNQKILELDGRKQQRASTVLGNRYTKLLEFQDDIVAILDTGKSSTQELLENLKVAFYLLGVVVPFLLLLDYRSNLKDFLKRFDIERKAESEMIKLDMSVVPRTVPETIKLALESCNLHACSDLFTKYKLSIDQGKLSSFAYDVSSEDLEQNGFASSVSYEKKLPIGDMGKNLDSTTVNVDKVFAKVIDALSEKLFTLGISVKMDIDGEMEVLADEEGFEQVLFQAMNHSIKSCSNLAGPRNINVGIKKLGATMVFNVSDNGVGFSKDWLRADSGFDVSVKDGSSVELLILKELATIVGCKIFFENSLASDGVVVGGRVQMVLRAPDVVNRKDVAAAITAGEHKNKEIVSLKRGKKKEILKDFEDAIF